MPLLFSVAIIAAAISHQSLGSLGEFAGRVCVTNFAKQLRSREKRGFSRALTLTRGYFVARSFPPA